MKFFHLTLILLTLTLGHEGHGVSGWPLTLSRRGSLRSPDDGVALETLAEDLSGRLENLTARLHSQEDQVTDFGAQLAKVTKFVYFSVTFHDCDVIADDVNGTLMYDKVVVNAGNGYDVTTGLFTAPADGLYAFHVQVGLRPADSPDCVEIELVLSSGQPSPGQLLFTSALTSPLNHHQHQQQHQQEKQQQEHQREKQQQEDQQKKQQQQQQEKQQQEHEDVRQQDHHREHHHQQQQNHHKQQQHYHEQQQQQLQQQHTMSTISVCRVGSDNPSFRKTVLRMTRGDTVHVKTNAPGVTLQGDGLSFLSGFRLISS